MKDELSPEALKAMREHDRERAARYRERNREKYNEYQREWRKNNPDRVKQIRIRYYERLAAKKRDAQ